MSAVALPPSYSSPSVQLFTTANDRSNVLPAYSPANRSTRVSANRPAAPPAPPKEFYFEMKKKGKLFASMTLVAEGAYSKHIPTFLEGQPVKGRVKLCLDKPDSFQSIVVHLQGQVITGANQGEQLTFIDITHPLWSQAMGDPRHTTSSFLSHTSPSTSTSRPSSGAGRASPSSPQSDTTPSPPAGPSTALVSPAVLAAQGLPMKFTGKLPEGEYTWEFSFDIPKEVVVPFGAHNEPQVFQPPQTFNERHTRASVAYEVTVKLCRNKLLKTDHRISASIGYIPLSRPAPFSPLRKQAYLDGAPLLGPLVDPEGWHAMEHIRIRGTLFNNRVATVGCTFFLAKPLQYTRGSVIPLCVELQSDDPHAVDLLASPKAIVVRLRRRIRCNAGDQQHIDSLAWRDSVDHSQLAVWWPSSEGSESEGAMQGRRRMVNGELHLRPDAKPTSSMAHFRIEYSVVLLPFDTAGFEGLETEQLLEVPVDVVVAYAPGVRPTMSAPPGYESDIPIGQNSGFLFESDNNF